MEHTAEISKMSTTPVGKLMLTMGLPMILSMMLQAVYNIVDSAFVSNMPQTGEAALNALTLAFPMQMLMVAISIGTGVGANALLSKSLGQQDGEKANRVAGNALFLAAVIYIVFLLFGLFSVSPYITGQTGNAAIREMAEEYLKICCILSPGIVFFSIYEKLLQATGRSLYSTIAQVAGAVTNMILDPIMIYGLLGCPQFGVKGAALATVIGQWISLLLALIFHRKVNREISSRLCYWKPSGRLILQIYTIGLPAIIAQALMSVMTYGLNRILGTVSESMVTAYGLYYKIQQFILFAAFGLRDAITPIVSYSHGMGSKSRIRAGIRYGMLYTFFIMAMGTLLIELFAAPLSQLFRLAPETESLCISAMRIISISFVFAGVNIAFQGIFQALDGGLESLILSLFRQILFVLPVAWALVQIKGAPRWLVWITFPIAEGLTALIGCLLMRRVSRKIRRLSDEAPA